jgi:hypothetical protein
LTITQIFRKYGKNFTIKENNFFSNLKKKNLNKQRLFISFLNNNFINTFKKKFNVKTCSYIELLKTLKAI